MRFQRLLPVPPLILLIGSLASADAITGRVVNASGVGVAGVDIDFVNLGSGGNPHEMNDGTDANGNFVTTVDPGIYEVRFFAPTPPTTTLLAKSLSPVSIHGTVNLGTITLTNGVSLQGTTVNQGNQPVGGIKIDVYNDATNTLVLMKNNVTSAFGAFNVAVPKNTALRAELLTSGVIGQTLAPRKIFGTLAANTNMGSITMQTGFHVSGTVHRTNGTNVVGADIDIVDPSNNQTLFTPNDDSNSVGVFDVVVPAGTYELDLIRPTGQVLVGVEIKGLVVAGATNVGVLTMRNGVFLSGLIRDRSGAPIDAADVNAFEVSTGLPLALGADNTNAAGFYSVVVPAVPLHVQFSPPGPHTGFDTTWHRDVVVTGNTTLNGRLGAKNHFFGTDSNPAPKGPIFPFGVGTRGIGESVPHVEGHLSPAGSATTTAPGAASSDASVASSGSLRLDLFGGRPGADALLVLGFQEHALAGAPLVHLVRPAARLPLHLGDDGSALMNVPLDALATAGTAYAQFLVIDPDARGGIALSSVLELNVPR